MNRKDETPEDPLRELLHEMEREREKLAPSFHEVWRHAQRALEQGEPGHRPAWWLLWTATGVTCAGLLILGAIHSFHKPAQPRLDVASAIASSQNSIARFSVEPPTLFPAWASPTASMLEPPRIPQ